jgi:RecA-family ATPase
MTNLPDFERCVLGAIILDNSEMKDISQLLTPADFIVEAHRKIFFVMLQLHQTNRPIDPQVLVAELERRKELKSVGGAVIADLTTNVPQHIGYYCRVVKDAAQRRRMESLLSKAMQSEEGSSAEMASRLISDLVEFQEATEFAKTGELFVNSDRFCSTIPEEIDWMVTGILPRGANGIIAGVPKVSKSWIAVRLALSLALGEPFLGFEVTRPCKVALISREDDPGLTGWRIRSVRKGMGFDSSPNLIVNTRHQSDVLMLDDNGQVEQVIKQLRSHRAEFAIFDVLNVVHSKDENDNSEMRQVLSRLTHIQQKAKCGIGVVHHFKKGGEGSWTERLRGSSAISGWVEWLFGGDDGRRRYQDAAPRV